MSVNRDCVAQSHATHMPAATAGTADDMFYGDPRVTSATAGDRRVHWLAMQGSPCSVAGTHGADTLALWDTMNLAINNNLKYLWDQISQSDWDELGAGTTYARCNSTANSGVKNAMIPFFELTDNMNHAARAARIVGYRQGPTRYGLGAPTDFHVTYGQSFSSDPNNNAWPIAAAPGTTLDDGVTPHPSLTVNGSGHRFARTDGVLSSLKYTCDLSHSTGFLHMIPYSTAPKPWAHETIGGTQPGWLSWRMPYMKCLCAFGESYYTFAFVLWQDFIYNLALQKEHRDTRDELSAAMRDVLDTAAGLASGDPAAQAALDRYMDAKSAMTDRARARTERLLGLYEKAGYREQCYLLAKIFPLAQYKERAIDGRMGKRLPYLPQVRTYMGAAGLNDRWDPLQSNQTQRAVHPYDTEVTTPIGRDGRGGSDPRSEASTSWLDHIAESETAPDRSEEWTFGYNGNACIPLNVSPQDGAFGFINLLTAHPDQFFLDNITPAQESSLVPQIQLYKTVLGEPNPGQTGSDNTRETEVPIIFNTFNSEAEIGDFLSSGARRGFGAGIKSFTFTYDGSNPFAAKKSIKAQLKIFANDFAELGKERVSTPGGPTYKYLDLALKTGGSIMDGVISESGGELGPPTRPGVIGNQGAGACADDRQVDVAQQESPGGGAIDPANDPIEKLRFKIRAVVGIAPPPTTRTTAPYGQLFTFDTDDNRRVEAVVEQGDGYNFYDPYAFGGTYVPNTEDFTNLNVDGVDDWAITPFNQGGAFALPDYESIDDLEMRAGMEEPGGWEHTHGTIRAATMAGTQPFGLTDTQASYRYFMDKLEPDDRSERNGTTYGTYRVDGGNEIQDALNNSFTTLTLTPTTHSFEVDQSGRVVMTINYLAYVEDFFDSPSFNIFMDPILSQRRIFRKLQFSKLRARCDNETLEQMREDEAQQIEQDKIMSLQSILRRLYDAQRVRYIAMSYTQLRNFQTDGPYSTEDTRGVRIFMPTDDRGPAREMRRIRQNVKASQGGRDPSEAQTRQILARTANDMDREYLSYFYAGDVVDVILEAIEETLTRMPTVLDNWKTRDDYPTFISDCDVEYEKIRLEKFLHQFRKFRCVLGPLEIVSPRDGITSKVINLSQLPISIKYFSEWLTDQILSKDEAEMPLPNFLNAFFNLLIRNFLNDDSCFKNPATQKIRMNQTVVSSYCDYQLKVDQSSNFLGGQALLAQGEHPVDSLTLATYASNIAMQDNEVASFYSNTIRTMHAAAGTRGVGGSDDAESALEWDMFAETRDFQMDANMSRVRHFKPLTIAAGARYPVFVGNEGSGVGNPLLSISGHNSRGGQGGGRGDRHQQPQGAQRRGMSAVQALQWTMARNAYYVQPDLTPPEGSTNPAARGRYVDVFGNTVYTDIPGYRRSVVPYNPGDLSPLPGSAWVNPDDSVGNWGRRGGSGTWNLNAHEGTDVATPQYYSEDILYTMATQNPTLHDTTYNFLIFCAGRAAPLRELQETVTADRQSLRGNSAWHRIKRAHHRYRIPHYTLGRQRGVVKEIKLTKTNSPGLQEVRFEQDGYDGLRQLREVYDVEVTMLCNPKLYPGTYIYIDPDGFFPARELGRSTVINSSGQAIVREYNLSQFGIGGYYMVIRSENKLSDGTLLTTATAKWVASIDPPSDNPAPSAEQDSGEMTTSEHALCARARRSELLKIMNLEEISAAAEAPDLNTPAMEVTEGG